MGIYFSMGVLAFGDGGQVVLEPVKEPRFMIKDSQLWELLSESDGERRFGPALRSLSLKWYRQPSLDACIAEQRNPVRADCFDAREIHGEVRAIHTRLRDMESSLPRRYLVRSSESDARWVSSVRVWFEGREMSVGAGWDHCMATSTELSLLGSVETPPQLAERLRMLVSHQPEIQVDLREQDRLFCHEATTTGGKSGPGRPITLILSSESAHTVYGGVLHEMEAFCRAVDAERYCVVTHRG